MKKILYILAAMVLCMALILPVGATDAQSASEAVRVDSEEAVGAETETEAISAAETVLEDATEQGEIIGAEDGTSRAPSPTETEIPEGETEDLAAIIGDADSRLEAIVGIAEAMGITLEEAEALLDKMVAIGDEHFGESDIWVGIRASILENPESWTIVAIVVLMLVALVIFIIRGLIKNTITQSANKSNITDIKTVLGINRDTGKSETLEGLKNDILGLKKNTERLELENKELKMDLELQSAAIIEAVGEVLEAVRAEDVKLDVIEGETAASVKINGEQALQIVQLLNIAMGRQMPRMSETTRKAWYDESVTKIKEAAGIKESTDGKQ